MPREGREMIQELTEDDTRRVKSVDQKRPESDVAKHRKIELVHKRLNVWEFRPGLEKERKSERR
jgi:hypothetical protein